MHYGMVICFFILLQNIPQIGDIAYTIPLCHCQSIPHYMKADCCGWRIFFPLLHRLSYLRNLLLPMPVSLRVCIHSIPSISRIIPYLIPFNPYHNYSPFTMSFYSCINRLRSMPPLVYRLILFIPFNIS